MSFVKMSYTPLSYLLTNWVKFRVKDLYRIMLFSKCECLVQIGAAKSHTLFKSIDEIFYHIFH